MFRFFHGLRGKLILTYTLVTVLALLALEVLVLAAITGLSGLTQMDQSEYFSDVIVTLAPQAGQYLQPGAEDLPGLQAWLEGVRSSGYASPPPQYAFDSPAAPLAPGEPLVVVSPQGVVLAQAPLAGGDTIGQAYAPPEEAPRAQELLQRALGGESSARRLTALQPGNHYLLAAPVRQAGKDTPVVGAVMLSVEPPPSVLKSLWPWILSALPTLLLVVTLTGAALLVAVMPFAALFGLIMSRGLTRRLKALTAAADAWSEGDFRPFPQDRSQDEIGYLGVRLRRMAERIQGLLQTQQELAMLEERNRLARELHDTVKQQTFATLMQIRAARNSLESDPQAALGSLEAAEGLVKTSQQELGRMIAELRPAALDGQGLAAALQAYLETWTQHTRIPADFQVSGERGLPLETEQALYRVAQEALANVARHSRASAASVRLEIQPGLARLWVADNGAGFDAQAQATRGIGLRSMAERMAAVGGRVTIESAPGDGTVLAAEAPIPDPKGL